MSNEHQTADEQLRKLRRFAEIVLHDFVNFSMDGGDIQDAAVSCGLLNVTEVTEPCGDECNCAEYGFPAECYKRTSLLSGETR